MSPPKTVTSVLVTGGAGFIGSNFLNWAVPEFKNIAFTCLDSLAYSGHLESLKKVLQLDNFEFVKGDIRERDTLTSRLEKKDFDWVVHLAAETHVDRSLTEPITTIETNIIGTANLLEDFRLKWANDSSKRFIHVSTDEVFGTAMKGKFDEKTPYDPSSPYSASKAGSDHLARAYFKSYGFPVIVTNCANNYGPFQYPEKLIPLTIMRLLEGKEVPIYGDGQQIREWLFAEDHAKGLWKAALKGKVGETYLFGSGEELTNIDIVKCLCELLAEELQRKKDDFLKLLIHVEDRPGHDRRYAIDSTKSKRDLDWQPSLNLKRGLQKTIRWYLENQSWLRAVCGIEFQAWLGTQYEQRLKEAKNSK